MAGKKKFYKRGWHHTKGRGTEATVTCGFCGRKVPKYKTFSVVKGFRINDPMIRKDTGHSGGRGGAPMFMQNKMRACPACARHRNIVRRKK